MAIFRPRNVKEITSKNSSWLLPVQKDRPNGPFWNPQVISTRNNLCINLVYCEMAGTFLTPSGVWEPSKTMHCFPWVRLSELLCTLQGMSRDACGVQQGRQDQDSLTESQYPQGAANSVECLLFWEWNKCVTDSQQIWGGQDLQRVGGTRAPQQIPVWRSEKDKNQARCGLSKRQCGKMVKTGQTPLPPHLMLWHCSSPLQLYPEFRKD
jgi:hypothetical protein